MLPWYIYGVCVWGCHLANSTTSTTDMALSNALKIEYRQLGKSGLRVSVPILGAMRCVLSMVQAAFEDMTECEFS